MDIAAPSRTLYVRNLPDKLQKQRLRRLLHATFSAHGRVVWIAAEKTMKLRGQAFVTLQTQAAATAALRALQGSDFLGHALAVAYARQTSDRAGGAALGGDGALSRAERADKRKAAKMQMQRQRDEAAAVAAAAAEQAKMQAMGEAAAAVPVMEVVVPPNKILFVEGVPKTAGTGDVADVLQELFARFAGFVEVRSVPGKDDIAFVEFGSDADAAVAMGGLDQHLVGTPPKAIKVTFAKK